MAQVVPQSHGNVNSKVSIADFFNIDILNLNIEEYSERVTLPTLELGMFPYVEVHSKDGEINSIEFISHFKNFSSELTELINRCAATFGPTKSGESILTQRDNVLLQRGLFSRMWHTIWFECGTDEKNGCLTTSIRVTIFNPSQNGSITLIDV